LQAFPILSLFATIQSPSWHRNRRRQRSKYREDLAAVQPSDPITDKVFRKAVTLMTHHGSQAPQGVMQNPDFVERLRNGLFDDVKWDSPFTTTKANSPDMFGNRPEGAEQLFGQPDVRNWYQEIGKPTPVHFGGGSVDGNYANGGQPNGNYANGGQPNGNYANSGHPNGNYANGGQPNGNYANGGHPNGNYANGGQPNGNYANGGQPNGNYARGGPPNGNYANGGPPNGNFDNGQFGKGFGKGSTGFDNGQFGKGFGNGPTGDANAGKGKGIVPGFDNAKGLPPTGKGWRQSHSKDGTATVTQFFGKGSDQAVKLCDCGNQIFNPRHWACRRCFYHLKGQGTFDNQQTSPAPVTPPTRNPNGKGGWASPPRESWSADPVVREEQERIAKERNERERMNSLREFPMRLDDEESEAQYLERQCRAFFSFKHFEKIKFQDDYYYFEIGILPYTPAATTLPLSTRKVHVETWLEQARKMHNKQEYSISVMKKQLAVLEKMKEKHELAIMDALKFSKELGKKEEEAPPDDDNAQAIKLLEQVAQQVQNPMLNQVLSTVTKLLTNMGSPTSPAQATAPAPATPGRRPDFDYEGAAGEKEDDEMEATEVGDSEIKRRRLTGKQVRPEVYPRPEGPEEIPISTDSEEADAADEVKLTKTQKRNLKKRLAKSEAVSGPRSSVVKPK